MKSLLGGLRGHPLATRRKTAARQLLSAGLLTGLASVALGAGPSHALTFKYSGLVPGYGSVPGNGNPSSGPWAQVDITDTDDDEVTLKVTNLVPAPYGDTITGLVFNLVSPQSLSATCSTGGTAFVTAFQGATCSTSPVSTGTDNQGLSGGGQATRRFDLFLDFAQSNDPLNAVNGGEFMTFVLTGSAGFNASSFLATNPDRCTGPAKNPNCRDGGYSTFAKFQSVGNGSGSVEVYGERYTPPPPPPAPGDAVPGPLPIAGAAAAFGYSRRLRQRLRSATS